MNFRIFIFILAIASPLSGMEQPSQDSSKIFLKVAVADLDTKQTEEYADKITIPENVHTVHDMAQELSKQFQDSDMQTKYSLERQEVVKAIKERIKNRTLDACTITDDKFKAYDERAHAFAAEVLLKAGKSVCSHYLNKNDYFSRLSIELLIPIIEQQIDTCSSLQDALKIITHLKRINKQHSQLFEDTNSDLMQAIINKIKLKNFSQADKSKLLYSFVIVYPNVWLAYILLQIGARYAYTTKDDSYLHLLAQKNDPKNIAIMQLLLDNYYGSIYFFTNERNNDGYTPLHIAAMHHNTQAVELLLDNGADAEARDNNNFSPLHWAMTSGKDHLSSAATIIQLLIDKGAKFDAPYEDGSTALHLACEWGYEPIIKVLENAGADMNKKNLLGYTPADCRLLHHNHENKKKESVANLLYKTVSSWITAHPKKAIVFTAGGLLLAGLGYYYLQTQQNALMAYKLKYLL